MEGLHEVDRSNFAFHSYWLFCTARSWRDPIVFLDTEFPGFPFRSTKPHYLLSAAERYSLLKQNADIIRPIQVGITLYNRVTKASITWQFNLCDFDVRFHFHASDSIAVLKKSGIDLEGTRMLGVPSIWIVQLLHDAGLMCHGSSATWVTFHGCNDFAILLKALHQLTRPPWIWGKEAELPDTLPEFMKLTRFLFGSRIYDVKCLMKRCSELTGGLERVAAQLDVRRTVGVAHQAGSDSMLTCQVFLKMQKVFFNGCVDEGNMMGLPCQGELFDLEEE